VNVKDYQTLHSDTN